MFVAISYFVRGTVLGMFVAISYFIRGTELGMFVAISDFISGPIWVLWWQSLILVGTDLVMFMAISDLFSRARFRVHGTVYTVPLEEKVGRNITPP